MKPLRVFFLLLLTTVPLLAEEPTCEKHFSILGRFVASALDSKLHEKALKQEIAHSVLGKLTLPDHESVSSLQKFRFQVDDYEKFWNQRVPERKTKSPVIVDHPYNFLPSDSTRARIYMIFSRGKILQPSRQTFLWSHGRAVLEHPLLIPFMRSLDKENRRLDLRSNEVALIRGVSRLIRIYFPHDKENYFRSFSLYPNESVTATSFLALSPITPEPLRKNVSLNQATIAQALFTTINGFQVAKNVANGRPLEIHSQAWLPEWGYDPAVTFAIQLLAADMVGVDELAIHVSSGLEVRDRILSNILMTKGKGMVLKDFVKMLSELSSK